MAALFKFSQGAAHVWDTHEIGLARRERALQEKLETARRAHDQTNQVQLGWGGGKSGFFERRRKIRGWARMKKVGVRVSWYTQVRVRELYKAESKERE